MTQGVGYGFLLALISCADASISPVLDHNMSENSANTLSAEETIAPKPPVGLTKSGRALLVFAILVIGTSSITSNCADPDLWGHVQYGREVLRDGHLHQTTTWSFAAPGTRWINHENIAELLLAWTVDTFGTLGLPILKLLLSTVIFGLMIRANRKQQVGWCAIALFVVLVGDNAFFHWQYRPHALSYMSLAVMLAVWEAVFRNWSAVLTQPEALQEFRRQLRWLWALPPLLCFWANSHGGFAAGLAILGTYHFLRGIELYRAYGQQVSGTLQRLGLVTAAAFLATLVNPYSFELWNFLLMALKLPRPEIGDWGMLEIFSHRALGFWLLLVVCLPALFKIKKHRDVSQLIIMGLLLWQGVSHCRHLSIFAIVAGFWMPKYLNAVLEKLQVSFEATDHGREVVGWLGPLSLKALGVITVAASISLIPRLSDVPVSRDEYPVSAMQFLTDKQLHGKVVVTFNWAQYALACFARESDVNQRSTVAVDGRFETCYPRELIDVYFDFWLGEPDASRRYRSPTSPPYDPARALSWQQPDLVLICRGQKPSVRVMEAHTADWTLLYQDSLAQLWGRTTRYDNPELADFLPPSQRDITETPQTGNVSWPAFPRQMTKQPPRLAGSPQSVQE